MYRTMEMRAEPKLSYAERLIISGSKRKIWFGYFLFSIKSCFVWLKENIISSTLKGICFLTIIALLGGGVFGIIFLLTLVPGKIVGWTFAVILSALVLYVAQIAIKMVIKEIVADLNEKANNLKEATLKKLGPPTPICCDIFGPPHLVEIRSIRRQVDEIAEKLEENTERILKELEYV